MALARSAVIWPSFNEARALCAGSCVPGVAPRLLLLAFNEARALCAGSWR